MNPKRIADICFFVGFAGVMYAVVYGNLKPDNPVFARTLAALIIGALLIAGSFRFLYKEKKRADNKSEEGSDEIS